MKKLIIGVGAGVLTLFYLLSFLNEEAPPPEPEARPMEFARSSLKMSRPAERNSSPKSVDPSEPSQPSPKTRKPRNRRQEARQKPDQKKKPLKKKASKDPPRPGYFQITEVNGYATFLGDILIEDVDEFIGKMDRGERRRSGLRLSVMPLIATAKMIVREGRQRPSPRPAEIPLRVTPRLPRPLS